MLAYLRITAGPLRFPSDDYPYQCPLASTLHGLHEKEQKMLAGQGFNMEIISCLSLFLMGCMVERKSEIPAVMSSSSVREGSDEEDEPHKWAKRAKCARKLG